MMDRIGDDVRLVFRRFGGPAEGMEEIVRVWPEAVGHAVARNAWPARLARDGTLHVAATSSTWAFELTQLSGQIQSRLVERLGDRAPRRLRFAPGKVPEPGPEPGAGRPATAPRPGPSERAQASRFAAAIEDDELRDLVARAAAASLVIGGSGRQL